MTFFPFRFFFLLSAALIGWLVGWLLGRQGSRPSESLDAELAGKMRLTEEERDRLLVENADIKAAIRTQLDKSNHELGVTHTEAAEQNAVRSELETSHAKPTLPAQTQNGDELLRSELLSLQKLVVEYEKELCSKEEVVEGLRRCVVELELQAPPLPKEILFPVDSAEITPEAARILTSSITPLCALAGTIVEIQGHTDSIDSDEHNHDLGLRRASAVRDFLVAHGVPAHGLTAVGYGASRPVADNAADDGRQRNRRIEFRTKEAAHLSDTVELCTFMT